MALREPEFRGSWFETEASPDTAAADGAPGLRLVAVGGQLVAPDAMSGGVSADMLMATPAVDTPTGYGSDISPAGEVGSHHVVAIEEIRRPPESRIRAATMGDLDDLVRVEMLAFDDVYGKEPAPDAPYEEQEAYRKLVRNVTETYRERIDMLCSQPGQPGMIRVIENAERGVYGMIVWVRTNLDSDDLAANGQAIRDMTDNDQIRDAYDAEGKNAYVVNLAVIQDGAANSAFTPGVRLMNESISIGNQLGLRRAFFESRLPQFEQWEKELRGLYEENGRLFDGSDAARRRRVEQYWRMVDKTKGSPVDMLMSYYVRKGGIPMGLVAEAWGKDRPSHGYGVLFGLELEAGKRERFADQHQREISLLERQVDAAFEADPTRAQRLGRHVLELNKKFGGLALLGAVIVGSAVLVRTGQGSEVWQAVQNDAGNPWLQAYKAAFSAYITSWAAIGLTVATSSAQKALERIPVIRDYVQNTKGWQRINQMNNWARQVALAANRGLAIVAGGLFIGAVTNTIPDGTAKDVLYAGGGADIISTVAGQRLMSNIFQRLFGGRSKSQPKSQPASGGD